MASKEISPSAAKKEVITYYLYSLKKPIIVNERIINYITITDYT
jgi:hypothetical protein